MKKQHLKKFFNKINEFSGKVSSLLVLTLIFLVSFSVMLRYVFSIGFTWLQDLYIWVHASFILLGIAYTLNKDGHVRIDIIYRKLNDKKKKIVNFFGSILFGLPLCYLIIFKGYEYFHRSLIIGENSKETGGLPNIFILKFLIFLMGILLFLELTNKIYSYFKDD